MTDHEPSEPEGQTFQTKDWVARRAAADDAIEAVRKQRAMEQALKIHEMEQRVNESPILLIIGFVVLLFVLVGGLWWFLDKVQCDPMISDRGMSSACKKAPQ
jgi:hypothetical protein